MKLRYPIINAATPFHRCMEQTAETYRLIMLAFVEGKFFDSRGQKANDHLIVEHRSAFERSQIDVQCV